MNCLLPFPLVHVIPLILESCFAFHTMQIKHVTRELKKLISIHHNYFSRFNGTSPKPEPSSKFSHFRVLALGSYHNSVFVTGSQSLKNGLKTEILDYKAKKWIQEKDYPFSNGH